VIPTFFYILNVFLSCNNITSTQKWI